MSSCCGIWSSACAFARSLLFSQLWENAPTKVWHRPIARDVRSLTLAIAFVTARCKLCPKQFSHVQLNFLTAAAMFAPFIRRYARQLLLIQGPLIKCAA